MGRSGSTLVMQLLGTDETCVMDRIYPLESRYLSLISQAAAQWDGRTFAEYGPASAASQNILGSNPVALRHKGDSEALVNIPDSSQMLRAMWQQFSLSARSGAPGSKFYAEKVVEWIPSFIAPSLDCCTLFLFRDPRDLFLSTNSFNSKRGYLAFGRNEGDSDLDHATTLAYRFLHRYENYRALQSSGARVSLIRYEDVASHPVSALLQVMSWTGLNIRELQRDETFEQHKTTTSLDQSIERWKREPVPDGVLDVFHRILGNILIELGYAHDSSTDSRQCAPDELKLHVSDLVNAEQVTSDDNGLELRFCSSADQTDALSLGFDFSGKELNDICEVWICLSGGFGGKCTIEWSGEGSHTMAQEYDVGRHTATLRFKLHGQPQTHRFRLSITHTGAVVRDCDRSRVRVHRINFITNPVSRQSASRETSTSRVSNFLNQFMRVNR